MQIWCRYNAQTSNLTNQPFTYRNDEFQGNYQVSLKHFGDTSARMLAEIMFLASDNSNINYLSRIHEYWLK